MGTNLKRTTIFLTNEQHEMLRRLAFVQRTSMAALLRDAALRILEDERDIKESQKAGEEVSSIRLEQYLREREEKEKAK